MCKLKRGCLISLILLIATPIAVFVAIRLYASIQSKNLPIYTVQPEDVLSFSLDDYEEEFTLFQTDHNVGAITGLHDVVFKAQTLWNERFSVITLAGFHEPNSGDGVDVFYDDQNACWLIRGTIPQDPLPPNAAGLLIELPNIIICENGDVLAMWLG